MKKKPKLEPLQIERLILLAEHLKKCRLQDYSEYPHNNRKPFYFTVGREVLFRFPVFIYEALSDLFPEE
jgi:hypothetical protein